MRWFRWLVLLWPAHSALALEGYVVGGGVEADTEDGVSIAALAEIGLTEKTWLSGAYARSRVDFPRGFTLDTHYADIGIDHFFEPLGLTLEAAYWGDSDILDSIDARASVYWRNKRFTISGDVEYRDFEFDFPESDAPRPRDVRFHANGVGLSARLQVTDVLSVNVTGIDYDYSVPLAIEENRPIIDLFSVSRLSLINSLVDYRVGGGLALDVGVRNWSLDYRTWRASVDHSRTHSATLRFTTPLRDNGDIEFGLGVDDSDVYGSVTFFSVFLYFYGAPGP